MITRALFLTLFFTICFSAMGQVDDFQKKIISCLKINGTTTNYEIVYDDTIHLLYKQFVSANAPLSFWEELRSDRMEKVNDLIPYLAFAYRKHFFEEDINEMIEFYQSDAAKDWLDSSSQLTEEQQKEVDSFLASDIGMKIESKKKSLKEDMDEIASHWKIELFSEKMSVLIKSGYSPQK